MVETVRKTEEKCRKELSPQQYRIMREKGTERAFAGEHWDHKEEGVYRCAGCGAPLFGSELSTTLARDGRFVERGRALRWTSVASVGDMVAVKGEETLDKLGEGPEVADYTKRVTGITSIDIVTQEGEKIGEVRDLFIKERVRWLATRSTGAWSATCAVASSCQWRKSGRPVRTRLSSTILS